MTLPSEIFAIQDRLSKPDKWMSVGNRYFLPHVSPPRERSYSCAEIIDRLNPGYYEIDEIYSPLRDSLLLLEKIDIKQEEVIIFPNSPQEEILNEMLEFWDLQKKYEQFNLPHKRGILLYGPPGNGKTTIVKSIIEKCAQHHRAMSLKFTSENLQTMMKDIRSINEKEKIIIVMEDLDAIVSNSAWAMSEVLNMLDGNNNIFTNCVFLATTNYPEKLQERVLNRPSRFDKRFKLGNPVVKIRNQYIESLLSRHDEEQESKKIDVSQWVKDTKGFSLAHIKEIFISMFIFDRSYEESMKNLKDMKKKLSSDDDKTNKLGYSSESL